MPNYKLTIQYEGTRYKGWQEQKHTEATIQGKLQRVLERMTEEEIYRAPAGQMPECMRKVRSHIFIQRQCGMWSRSKNI